jgi:hypothetical protein
VVCRCRRPFFCVVVLRLGIDYSGLLFHVVVEASVCIWLYLLLLSFFLEGGGVFGVVDISSERVQVETEAF